MLQTLVESMRRGTDLTREQVLNAVAVLTDEAASVEEKAALLSVLAEKGESPDEIAWFASALRDRCIEPPLDPAVREREIVDVCGTGGDRLNTFNISTAVSLVVAAAGLTVAKHGNRAVTSESGSADVLEALGIRVELSPAEAAAWLRDHGFAFLFAPRFHPAFKHIGPARQLCAERGQRTIFNFLGPLLNPARPTAQLVGVSRPELCEQLAKVLQALGVRRGMVVSGSVADVFRAQTSYFHKDRPFREAPAYMDELSTLGDTTIAEFHQEHGLATSVLPAGELPAQPATLADLAGGNPMMNAAIIRLILQGNDRGPRRDAVLLNAGAALFIGGRSRSITDGWTQAAGVIDSGAAWHKLQELVEASRG